MCITYCKLLNKKKRGTYVSDSERVNIVEVTEGFTDGGSSYLQLFTNVFLIYLLM